MLKKLVIVLLVLVVGSTTIGCNLTKNPHAATSTPAPVEQMTPLQRIAQLENKIVLLERELNKLEAKVAALTSGE
jgi:hypothetical protein